MPKISVVIPVYNCESYIKEALKSVQKQSVRDLEIIVVNDGSTDGTLSVTEALAERDERIRIISQANSGKPAIARNVGLRHAGGKYVCFLDGDDLFMPGKLEKQLEIFLRFPELNLVFHDVRHLYEDDRHEPGSYLGNARFTHVAKDYMAQVQENIYLCGENFYNFISAYFLTIHTSAVMATRSCLEAQSTWFPEDATIGEDADLWFRLALSNRTAYLDEVLSCYRQHSTSITSNMANYLKGSILVHRRNLERGEHVLTREEKKLYEKKIQGYHWHYGYLLYSNYEMKLARKEYLDALKLGFSPKTVVAIAKTMLPRSFVRCCKTFLKA
ncbi:glycosyltransferase family A protein [Geotalea sp. SG265]|uniref:glycosyltransferase family 2 protein n=1 Tax=Geotalea sp. SG265 TaxID=2922867 RepID=UPI001FAFD42F|nr:glycosyltransferase family A protein [Geotalea sp. SG265]